MKIYFYILFVFLSMEGKAQIPLDSISHKYFEKENISEIQKLKAGLNKNTSPWVYMHLAQKYEDVNIEDSATLYFEKAYNLFNAQQKTLGQIKALQALILNLSGQDGYSPQLLELKDNYKNIISNNTDKDWLLLQNAIDSVVLKKRESALNLLYQIKSNKSFRDTIPLKVSLLSTIAVCHKQLKKYNDSVKFYYDLTLQLAKENKLNNRLFYTYLNYGNFYALNGKPSIAVKYYDSAESTPLKKLKLKSFKLLYKQKALVLEDLGELSKSLNYLKASDKIDSLVNEKEQNIAMYKIEANIQVKETKAKLSGYEKFIKSYKRYKVFYIIGLSITLLLSLYSFVRWRREGKEKRMVEGEKLRILDEKLRIENEKLRTEQEKLKLEKEKQRIESENLKIKEEHTVSLEEISNLKKRVEKEHIILKNKSKVHLSDLMFIKSEGHYLELYTQSNKEFIRGKMSEIIKQLPPNFQRSHRSYIVNKNYIHYIKTKSIFLKDGTEIPISRNNKVKFN